MPKITVIICTHNPRPAPLVETLDALRAQTLPLTEWELLVVDNASKEPLSQRLDLSWHPAARIVREETPGIAPARMRAMREFLASTADLMLFVDDDNVLAPDYLAIGIEIAAREPKLGCWGGQLIGRFAAPLPDWIHPFLKYLAVFPLERELRLKDSFQGNYDCIPATAGMFIRRVLAEHHLQLLQTKPAHLVLGGTRGVRVGAEDMDLGLSVLDLGGEAARFPQLRLTHLISEDRLTEEYMAKLIQSIRTGILVLEHLRGIGSGPRSRFSLWVDQRRACRLPSRHRRFMEAEIQGELQARKLIGELPD